MPRTPDRDEIIRSAVEDVYNGLLARFRNTLLSDGFENAETFVNGVLPYVRLILQRIDEELEEARMEQSEEEVPEEIEVGGVVDLDRLSDSISALLEKIPSRSSTATPARMSLPPAAVRQISQEEVRSYAETTKKVTQEQGYRTEAFYPPGSKYGSTSQATSVQGTEYYAPSRQSQGGQSVTHSPPQVVQNPVNSAYGTQKGGYGVQAQVQTQYQSHTQSQNQSHAQSQYQSHAQSQSQYPQAAAEPGGGGRYGGGAYYDSEFNVPQRSDSYAPRQIDQLILYSNVQRERRNYPEALRYLEMAKELPEYFIYDFYRDEVLDLEDRIERERSRGAPTYVANVVDTRYGGFDYISQKKKEKDWLDDDDF